MRRQVRQLDHYRTRLATAETPNDRMGVALDRLKARLGGELEEVQQEVADRIVRVLDHTVTALDQRAEKGA